LVAEILGIEVDFELSLVVQFVVLVLYALVVVIDEDERLV
jgi:hypothetical protein